MVQRHKSLQPLLRSQDGLHLSAYIPRSQSPEHFVRQVEDLLPLARQHLGGALSPEEISRFLEPILRLAQNCDNLGLHRTAIGIFRTPSSFRLLSLPFDTDLICVVATSYHVKPLLKWLQQDRDFVLVGLSSSVASVYAGNQSSFVYVDDAAYPKALLAKEIDGGLSPKERRPAGARARMRAAARWVADRYASGNPRIFVAGDPSLTKAFLKNLSYRNVESFPLAFSFQDGDAGELCWMVRQNLRERSRRDLQESLFEFQVAEDNQLACNDLEQVAREVCAGRVKKLIVAEGINIFGKLSREEGVAGLSPLDSDHEDDDLLDDLAQAVLLSGGEVVVAPREAIPKGRPVLAILREKAHRASA